MNKVYIIAEAGVNHNGCTQLALQLVDAAVEAGVDAIKFQTFSADNISSRDAKKAEYQQRTTAEEESQWQMLKKLELDAEAHRTIRDYCREKGIEFLSSPFDRESLEFLTAELSVSKLKLASGEITNAPLLLKAAGTGKPIFLSTGMSTLGDIEAALGVLAFGYTKGKGIPSLQAFSEAYSSTAGQQAIKEKVVLLHCTTEYPAPFSEISLRAMDTLRQAFGLPVGYSDHTSGFAVSIAAVALGAAVIEKHFTLDCSLPGPDHKASLEPAELKAMVQAIRQVEQAMGDSRKKPARSEWGNRSVVRKSVVAAKDIAKGEAFDESNLTVKRPSDGVSPIRYWEFIGKKAERDYRRDERVGV